MTSGGNAGAGAGANAPTAGAEGGIAESVSMAAHGHEAPASVSVGYDAEFGDPTGYMSSTQIDAVTQATATISRNAGSRSIQIAQRDAMVAAGVPGRLAGELAVEAMRSGRSAPAGSIEERMGVFPDQIAATAATAMMPAGMGMVIGAVDFLADQAVIAGWDVQDPSGMDYGDTPQSTGGQGGVGVDMAAPAPTPAPAPPPAPPPVEPVAAAPAPAPAPSGPTAATGATATPLSAVGAASTRARRRGRSSTIATSTLGVPQSATVARKTLLGS